MSSQAHLGRVGDYAALSGGQGREIFFRPERYRRSQLEPLDATIGVTTGGHVHRGELVDVSQNGASFVPPPELRLALGSTIAELTIAFDGHQAYRAAARVSSLRHTVDETIVGVSFEGAGMDIEAVLQLRNVKGWTGRADAPPSGVRAPWRVAGNQRFKALVAELGLHLADGNQRLTEMESGLPWAVIHGEAGSPARDALVARVRREFADDVTAYSRDLDDALRAASRAEREALREFSARHLDDALMQAPWMRRARDKPLGYPGDFEVMNQIYGGGFDGSTLFAKAVSLAFASTPGAEAVRARKDLIKSRLRALLDDPRSERPLRILSIAAGPAQEIFELLQERRLQRRPVEIVLFDQDKRALSYAYRRLRRLAGAEESGQVRLTYLHDSIKRLLRGADVFGGQGAFDAVYSCGLADYLQTRTATSLCASLYALLAPGGTLYVGNMVPANPGRWFMELHLDWFLVYRETAELLAIGRAAAPEARIALLEESTRVNPFIALARDRT